ncbi:MAG: alpha/beta hydrolase [Oscillospiraceae bacterium]|nr:alpha/beta hydrolase [Oscillospiraceae bacterium]
MNNQTKMPPVPFDPELNAVLEQMKPVMPKLTSVDEFIAAREQSSKMHGRSDEELHRNGVFNVEERIVSGPPNEPDITLLMLRPNDAQTPTPAFYYIHGGGMISGDRRSIPHVVLEAGEEHNAAIISVEYRLAPETKYPGSVSDCYAGLKWISENAAELNIDPAQIIVIGVSAGGGLAAATVLLARDRNSPAVAAQILLCPMLDDRNNTPSVVQMTGRGIWDYHANKIGWTALLGDACGGSDVPIYASPARATDLSGLPPTYIDVGSAESFRDEAIAYANLIWYSGGQAELHVFNGGYHAYESIAPLALVSQETYQTRLNWMRRIIRFLKTQPE